MFDVNCPTCGARRLVTHRRITAMHNTDTGIRVYFTCVCGAMGLWISGRHASTPGVFWAPGDGPAGSRSIGAPGEVAA